MNKLTARQQKFIDELFQSGGDEAATVQKCQISTNLYRRWLKTKVFADEIALRSGSARRQSQILLAQYVTVAAAKLVELTGSEKEETARRACLDILSLNNNISPPDHSDTPAEPELKISPEIASKLLKILAEDD